MPEHYGYEVGEQRATATISAAVRGPFNFIDTSNNYGAGAAERYIGRVLADAGGLPSGFVLATKADADPVSGDFSGDRVRRSVAESLERLGLDRIQLMYLHDPELHLSFAEAMAPGGAVAALTRLRDQGVLGHLGVAGGDVQLLREFIATGLLDIVLCHNRFTLIDRSAEPLMDERPGMRGRVRQRRALRRRHSGQGPNAQPRYAYEPASEASARRSWRCCCMRGARRPAGRSGAAVLRSRSTNRLDGGGRLGSRRIDETATLMTRQIPGELWAELDQLADARRQ